MSLEVVNQKSWWFKLLIATSWFALGSLVLCALLRIMAHDAMMFLVWLNSFTLYIYLPAYIIVVFAVITKQQSLSIITVIVILFHLLCLFPDCHRAKKIPDEMLRTKPLRIFSTNLLMVNRTKEGIIKEIEQADADVLLFQEYSPQWHRALLESGVLNSFQEKIFLARSDSFGIALYSKYKLISSEIWEVVDIPMIKAHVEFSGKTVCIYNIHTLPPRTQRYTKIWNEQTAIIVDEITNQALPIVLMGDFNMTQHSYWYQEILSKGFSCAFRDTGSGFATTFPNGIFPLPSIRLDQAFLSKLICTQLVVGEGRGSDHRPIILDIVIP